MNKIKELEAVIASPAVRPELKTRAVAELSMIRFNEALKQMIKPNDNYAFPKGAPKISKRHME